MLDQLYEILIVAAPIVAGTITSVVIPFIIKHFTVKRLQKKIDEVTPNKQLMDVKRELEAIKREIWQMRGKMK